MSKKLHQQRSENSIVFFAIDMSTEERSWKDCPKGGAATQALEMPTLTVSALLRGNDFYLKGCCETRNASTFFVIAVKEVSKNDGNGIFEDHNSRFGQQNTSKRGWCPGGQNESPGKLLG